MYTAFYHLREEPFKLTSDPRFFHLAEPHAIALSALIEAVMRRQGFMVLTGQIGVGKTILLHTALQILTERASGGKPLASAFILNPKLSRDEFLETLLMEFEIPCTSTSKPARLAALNRMLQNVQRKGGTSVLLVDEAHLLSPDLLEEIRLLSNADTHQEKPLQIVLSGQPELLGLLQRPDMRAVLQRIARNYTLRPLSFPELRAYVAERLYAAGFREAEYPFPTPALEVIFRFSKGVPRLINLLCDTCLVIGCKTKRPSIQVDMVEEAVAELKLVEMSTAEPVKESVMAPAYSGNGTRAALTESEIDSTIDVIIEAMKRRRSSPME
jgi:general secretion pathway protein A